MMNDLEFYTRLGMKAVKYRDCSTGPGKPVFAHQNDVCHYELSGCEILTLPESTLQDLYVHAVPIVLNRGLLIETYAFKQTNGTYYVETAIWQSVKDGVLKGTRLAMAFEQDVDVEAATARALRRAIEQLLEQEETNESG